MHTIKDPGFSTFGLFVVTLFLFFATRSLARSARETGVHQLRAYVAVESGSVQFFSRASTMTLAFAITVKNFGCTPAFNFKTCINVGVHDSFENAFENAPSPDPMRAHSILAPSQEAHLYCNIIINEEQFMAVNQGKCKVFAFGRVEFIDVFRKKRFFIFRSQNRDIFIPNHCSDIQPCSSGYEAN